MMLESENPPQISLRRIWFFKYQNLTMSSIFAMWQPG